VRKVNQLKAGALLSYVSMGLGYLISIIYTPLMLRLLGQNEYGLYNMVASVVSYLGLFNFGFGSAYIRYYSRYKVNNDELSIARLNGMFLLIFSLLGLLAGLAGAYLVIRVKDVFGEKISPEDLHTAKLLMAIMVLNIVISLVTTVFNAYVTANEEYIFQKLLQMAKSLLGPFVMLPALLMGFRSIGMAVVTTGLSVLAEMINLIYCCKKKHISLSFRRFDLRLMREMTVFSSYVFLNMIIDQINWNVGKFILGRYKGTVAVAIYGLAAQLNSYYISLSTAISNVFIPRVNRMVARSVPDYKMTIIFAEIGRLQFLVLSLICSGLIFFGKPFITMWAGADYSEAYPVALLLIIPVTVPLIQNLGIEIQKAKNMHRFRSLVYFLIALFNLGLSIAITGRYGCIGTAASTAAALIIGNGLIMNIYYHRRLGLDMRYFWWQIAKFLPSMIAPLLTGILLNIFIDLYQPLTFVICGLMYVIVFCASVWIKGLNSFEKSMIGKSLAGIFARLKLRKGYV